MVIVQFGKKPKTVHKQSPLSELQVQVLPFCLRACLCGWMETVFYLQLSCDDMTSFCFVGVNCKQVYHKRFWLGFEKFWLGFVLIVSVDEVLEFQLSF